MKWYKVPGYQAEVTKNGDIRNLYSKLYLKSFGKYKLVNIKLDNNVWRSTGVHQLVALTFIGPCPKGKEVNHKDLDKSNNHYKNLEYLTHKKNMEHAVKNGRSCGAYEGQNKGESNGRSKLNTNQVIDIRFLYLTNLYTQEELAKEYNTNDSIISKIINNVIWK